MHKRIRWISPLGAAVAAAIVGIVIITSSAAGTDDPGSRLNVFKTGTSTTPSASVIASLTQIGTDATDVQAVTVPALDGSATPWTVAQSTEGVCLVQSGEDGSTKTNCGTTAALSRGATVGFTPDEVGAAALGVPRQLPDSVLKDLKAGRQPSPAHMAEAQTAAPRAGNASFYGVAANDVADVAAVSSNGKVLGHDSVENNVYYIPDLQLSGIANIRLTHTSGEQTLEPFDW